MENKPFFKEILNPTAIYIGFLNSIHSTSDKYDSWHKCNSDNIMDELINSKNYKILCLIEGAVSDLVDHFMTTFIYPIIYFIKLQKRIKFINIISGDHAGWCTRTCFEKIFKWQDIKDIQITNSTRI